MIDRNFFILERSKISRLLSLFRQRHWAKISVILLSLLILVALALGVFLFSFFSFRFLGEYPEANQPVIVYTLAVTFILTSVLVLFSSLITNLSSLFQRPDNLLVFSLPIETRTLFESRFLEGIILNSWPLLVFALPQILGYSLALKLGLSSTLLFLFGLLLLVSLVNLLGTNLALALSRFSRVFKVKAVKVFLWLLLPLLAWVLIKILLPSQLVANLEALSVEEISQLVKTQTLMSPLLPTTWLVNLVYFWQELPLMASQSLGLLLVTQLVFLILTLKLRETTFRQAVDRAATGRFIASPRDVTKKKARPFPYLLPGRIGALTEKDWLVIFRSSGQVFQIAFLFFLQIIYLLIISRVPYARVQRLFPGWYGNQWLLVNFLFISYLASVLAIRFFFPMISLEGHSSWIIWSAPLPRMKLFFQKLITSFLLLLAWLELSTLLSLKIINLPLLQHSSIFWLNIPLAIALTSLSLGLGAIKPNFWEKNPEKLSTSSGGLLTTFFSLAFISSVAFLIYLRKGINLETQVFTWFFAALVSLPVIWVVSLKINDYEV